MRALALVILLTACRGGGDDDYRIIPSGDDTTISPRPDAPIVVDAPDGGGTINGRVCVLVDPRDQTMCVGTGVGGLAVTLGTQNAITADDGTFSIINPGGPDLVWRVSGTNFVTSVMPLTSTPRIPMFTEDSYTELMVANLGTVLAADQGSIFARVVTAGGDPLPGAKASSVPQAQFLTHYDGPTATSWTETATSTFGMAWLPGLMVSPTTVTVTPLVGNAVEVSAPVEQGATTFITVAVP